MCGILGWNKRNSKFSDNEIKIFNLLILEISFSLSRLKGCLKFNFNFFRISTYSINF